MPIQVVLARIVFASLATIAAMLFPLKILEQRANGASWRTSVTNGIWNRLDDPSLWALFASAIAVTLLARASRLTFSGHIRPAPRPAWGTYWLLWPFLSGLIATIYLIYVFDQRETVFYCLKSAADRSTVFGTPAGDAVETIQLIEGGLALLHIAFIGVSGPLLVNVVETLRASLRSGRKKRRWRRAAGACASIAAAPFIATLVAYSATEIVLFIGGTRNFVGLSDYVKLLLTLALYAAFYVFAGMYAFWRLSGYLRFRPTPPQETTRRLPLCLVRRHSFFRYPRFFPLFFLFFVWILYRPLSELIPGPVKALIASWEPVSAK